MGELVGVARQTISKWELGETSPDIKEAKTLAQIFHVTLDELVDNDIKKITKERKSNTEKLATLILLISKIFLGITIFILIIIVPLKLYLKYRFKNSQSRELETSIYCKLYGEEHGVTINYYENSDLPISISSDGYFEDILHISQYDYAHQMLNVINDYVKKNGGSCERIEEHELNNLVEMQIKEGTLTKTSATVVISEADDYNIIYGETFWIEKYNQDNTWTVLENINDNCAFNLPAYHIDSGKTLELKQDWTCMYGELSKGIYRLVKDANFESDIPITETKHFYIWTEFIIE